MILKEEDVSWRPLLCSDPSACVELIIQASTDQWGIEQSFHDLKEVEGEIEQVQLRRYYSNVGALNLNLWVHTLTEVWAWRKSTEELVNRQASPWDQADCRPSHSDRSKSLKQYVMRQEYLRLDIPDRLRKRIQPFVEIVQLRAA